MIILAAGFSPTPDADSAPSSRVSVDANTQHAWESLINTIASLPDKVTAKLGKETR